MKKKTKMILGFSIAGLTIAGVLIAIRLKKKRELMDAEGRIGTQTGTSVCVIFPLKMGSGIGDNKCAIESVKVVQTKLNAKSASPLMPLAVDGKFGEKTKARLDRVYQVRQVSKEFYTNTIKSFIL